MTWGQPQMMHELLEEADFVQTPEVEQLMSECLVEEKVDFVANMVEHGFAMRKYLTVEVLRALYQNTVTLNYKTLRQTYINTGGGG